MSKQETKIAQLRRMGSIQKVINKVGGTTIRQYRSETQNRDEDGVPDGDYKIGQIIGTKQYLAPQWHIRKQQWCFDGELQELNQLIEQMKLRYEDGPRKGEIISIDHAKPENRLTDRNDPVFTHSDFYDKFFFESDRADFNQANPKHAFMWMCQLGAPGTLDRSKKKKVSKYDRGILKMEAVSPKNEAKGKREKVENIAKATTLLYMMKDDEDKLHTIATAMALPSYNRKHNTNQVYMAIWSEVIDGNEKPRAKYGNRTIQSRFIELAEKPAAELSIAANVMTGRNSQIIVKRANGYLLNGEVIPDVSTDYKLIKYFLEPENQAEYLDLVESLGDKAI